jgi:condensin complex subunit 2
MEEISTSFCFICLLHLANEQGLKIESSASGIKELDESEDDKLSTGARKIGDIWDLKVSFQIPSPFQVNLTWPPQIYRDPNATQSA